MGRLLGRGREGGREGCEAASKIAQGPRRLAFFLIHFRWTVSMVLSHVGEVIIARSVCSRVARARAKERERESSITHVVDRVISRAAREEISQGREDKTSALLTAGSPPPWRYRAFPRLPRVSRSLFFFLTFASPSRDSDVTEL